MSYRFIYGRIGSGKSRTCYQQICDSRNNNEQNCMLIVPEQYSFQSEMDLLSTGGEKTAANVLVCSFKRLSFWVKNKYGIVNEKQVNKAGKNLMLTDIIERNKDRFHLYGGIDQGVSFVNRLSSLISEFKRYGVTFEQMKESLSSLDKESSTYKKVHDLVLLYTEYQNAITGLTDPDDSLFWLAKTIKEDGLFTDYEVWIDRFDGFTPCEFEVILQLMINAKRVNIAVCTDRLSDERVIAGELFYPVIKTCEKIMALGDEKGIPREKPVKLTGSAQKFVTKELMHLEQNLFQPNAKVYKEQTDHIKLTIYENAYEEIKRTAGQITCLVRDYGYRYSDISVVCSDMESYESYIRSIFTQYRIPFFIDMKKEIDNNPLIVFVNALLRIHVNRYRSEDIFVLLKTGLTDTSMKEIDLLENYVLKFGIQGSLWDENIEWSFIKEQSEQSILYNEDDINLIKNAVIEEIRGFFDGVQGTIEPLDFFSKLYEFLDQYGVLSNYKKMTAKFKSEGNLENANRNISAYNAFMNLLDTSVEVLKNKKYTVSQYAKFIESGISGYESGSVPPAIEQVNVGNVQRSMVHQVKAVFLLGANEGKFPGISLDEGLLSDHDRSVLQGCDIQLAPDTLSHTFEMKYLTYKTLCLPSEKLFISCPSMDMKGGTLRPAYIYTVLKRLFESLVIDGMVTGFDKAFEECVGTPESTFQELIRMLSNPGDKPIPSEWVAVKRWFENNKEWNERIHLLYKALQPEGQSEPMDERLAGELFGQPIIGSVSAFESYTNCPFAYFLQYGIKAREREIAQLSPLGIGLVSHTVLEMFFQRIKDHFLNYSDITEDAMIRFVHEEMNRAALSYWGISILTSKRNEYLLNRIAGTLGLTVKILLRHILGGEFRPINQEVIFGGKSGLKPVSESVGKNRAIITGKIDRLDVYMKNDTAFIRIIDYKTGSKVFSLEDFYYGLQMQLPIYMKAVLENRDYFKGMFHTREIVPAGILYYNIDDPVVKTGYMTDPSEIEDLITEKLMLRGLVLESEPVILAMDKNFKDQSKIIKVKKKKDGGYYKTSETASPDYFEMINEYTGYLVRSIVNNIGSGVVERYPVLKGDYKGCQYCLYKGLCGFDPTIKGCRYHFLPKMNEEEIQAGMMEKLGKENHDED